MTRKTSPAYRASKEETIPINKLHPFSNHPFHICHDLEFSELVDSMLNAGERNISMMHRKMSAMRDKSICMENRENGLCSY